MGQRDVTRSILPGEEWIGALVTLPSYVTGEGEPYRPVAVMWVDAASRFIVDATVLRPDEALARAAELFVRATREPKEGPPHTPARLRVADSALAAALRGSVAEVELVVAPTPEIDEIVAVMTERLSDPGLADPRDPSFLGPDVSPRDVAALFAAAARMYRVAPWKALPPDVCIGVSCDVLGIVDGAMIVVGQMGESYGFSLFASMERAIAFYEAVDAHEAGEEPDVPGHIMFAYNAREELPAELVREVDEHRWELASRDAYPSPTVIDDDRVGRRVTRDEMLGLTAIMTALGDLVETEPGLAEAWEREDAALTWNRTVETPGGSVTVELRMPVALPFESSVANTDDLLDEEGELDEQELDAYAQTLLDELARVPGVDEPQLRCADLLIVQAGLVLGVPLLQASPKALQQLMFQHIPAKVSIEADLAPSLIEAARHLMTLGAEKLGIEAAKACLASLASPDLSARLARALADESLYSPAKVMIMQGLREGYDLATEQGVAAWIEELARRAQPRKVDARAKGTARTSARRKPAAKKAAPASTKPKPKAKAKAKAKQPSSRRSKRRGGPHSR